ncbi:MAG: hypothetical protein BM557_04080 [Flavobacterium sp. MedPE-SWcel]|uniref:polysaccharide (de)acetylase n=1 Tax=uncultured Flavobacterium sp. TaxID=165435 RepID=UPI00091735B2|nr:polysaccharide (de)acetylase [uncultured Flavobacterium sp.]OIQ21440.1 MAG: hypothetical protein BM557_04080 [Flavobacterium sp. MedPE-SWcel]
MLGNLKNTLSRTLTNVKGKRISDKIVVIESDDWGSIRMPNKQTRDAFEEKGYNVTKNPYCKYDTLASSDDLTKLFTVLLKYKDKKGNHPVITANTVVANPDFEAIKKSNYTEYSYKPFTTTLKEYYPNDDVFGLWKEGMDKKIFVPQYHGREHLNVPLWLGVLQNNDKVFMDAFDMGFWGLPKNVYAKSMFNIQASYSSVEEQDVTYYKSAIKDGLDLFESIFNYRSITFIANNYTWSPALHETLKDNGVVGFQSMKYQKIPKGSNDAVDLYPVYTGKKNELNQVYMVRNCAFEPSQTSKVFNDVKHCLQGIESAFLFKKPAIIASHRLNFIGEIDSENRTVNLAMLDELLEQILKKWPDVIFMTSNQLASYLDNNG